MSKTKKKLFSNYNYEFDSNERKIITTFSKQVLKQLGGDEQYFGETKAFTSLLEKLDSGSEVIKLTKDEKTRLTNQLKQNIDHLEKRMKKSWFIKRWFMNSLYKQYNKLYENHFKG